MLVDCNKYKKEANEEKRIKIKQNSQYLRRCQGSKWVTHLRCSVSCYFQYKFVDDSEHQAKRHTIKRIWEFVWIWQCRDTSSSYPLFFLHVCTISHTYNNNQMWFYCCAKMQAISTSTVIILLIGFRTNRTVNKWASFKIKQKSKEVKLSLFCEQDYHRPTSHIEGFSKDKSVLQPPRLWCTI